MHLSEGILHLPALIGCSAVAAAAVAFGIKRLDERTIPLNALFAAAFFVAGTIHIPLGLGSVHLILNGMAGLFLGWTVFPAFLIALLLQTVFFSFGGFAVLGANLCIMGFSALAAHYLFRPLFSPAASRAKLICAGIGSAIVGVGGALCIAAFLLFLDGGRQYVELIYLLFIGHLPVMLVDSIISCGVILLFTQMQPSALNFTAKEADS